MDFNIACALHYASKCEGYLFNDEYFNSESFMKDFEKVVSSFDLKKSSNLSELKKKNAKAKSYDYGMIT